MFLVLFRFLNKKKQDEAKQIQGIYIKPGSQMERHSPNGPSEEMRTEPFEQEIIRQFVK